MLFSPKPAFLTTTGKSLPPTRLLRKLASSSVAVKQLAESQRRRIRAIRGFTALESTYELRFSSKHVSNGATEGPEHLEHVPRRRHGRASPSYRHSWPQRPRTNDPSMSQ